MSFPDFVVGERDCAQRIVSSVMRYFFAINEGGEAADRYNVQRKLLLSSRSSVLRVCFDNGASNVTWTF